MNKQAPISRNQSLKIARIVQQACIQAASDAYENAAISGLCGEGALEAAIGAIRMLDLETVLDDES